MVATAKRIDDDVLTDDLPYGDDDNVVDDVDSLPIIAEAEDDWVAAMIEHGELSAIREALSDSIDAERKAARKWARADERFGGRLRSLRAEYEQARSNSARLFAAATNGLT